MDKREHSGVTRFLSFVILLLHLLSDVKRRVALATTAAIVMAIAMVAVVGTVATGASAAPHAGDSMPTSHVAQPEPRAIAAVPLTSRQQSRLPVLGTTSKASSSIVPPPVAASSSSLEAQSVTSSVSSNTSASSSVHATLAQVALGQNQVQCKQGQRTLTVADATVTLQQPAIADAKLVWSWEVRSDGGVPPDQPPVDNTPVSQPIHAGDTSVSLLPSGSMQPLLTAAVSSTYSYSIRVYVTGSFDGVSDWLSVPANSSPCPDVTQ